MKGYFNFSIAWVLLAAFLYLLREKTNSARVMKSKMIQGMYAFMFNFTLDY